MLSGRWVFHPIGGGVGLPVVPCPEGIELERRRRPGPVLLSARHCMTCARCERMQIDGYRGAIRVLCASEEG